MFLLVIAQLRVLLKIQNRFKSSGVAFVNSTPLGYINKGNEIKLKAGDKFLLNIEAIDISNPSIIDEYKYDVIKPY